MAAFTVQRLLAAGCPTATLHDVVDPAEPLKTETAQTAIPIPQSLAAVFSAHVARWPAETLLTNQWGQQLGPWALERAFRQARAKVPGLTAGFR